MTPQLPPPIALDLPEEDPAALAELAAAVTGGAFSLGLLGVHLTGPAASVRDWVGRDAAAAAAQVGVLDALVHRERDAVSTAAARLEAHGGLVRDAVARVLALRAAQHEELGAAVHRLAVLGGGPVDPVAGGPPEAVAVVEEWRDAEARRGREHAALLARLAEDAAATAGVLAGCTAVVGGTGAPGDDARVLRSLALALPGWGDQEMAGRARALAAALTGPVPRQRVDELAAGATDWVAVPAYADALLAGLGADGVRWLLSLAGDDARGAAAPVAVVLAGALGAARPGGPGGDPGRALAARYVDPGDADGAADVVVLGMGAVLGAGLRVPGGGPSARVLASWGAQLLARERVQRATAPERVPRAVAAEEDPVELLVRSLVRSRDATAAATLLAAPAAWAALLARTWRGGADDVVALARLGAAADGAAGAATAEAGLRALGEGLAPASSGTWTVDRATAAALAPALGQALARRTDVLVGLLTRAAGAAPLSAADDAALRGLGCLTWDGPVAGALGAALAARLTAVGTGPGPSSPAAALGAFVAVQQYGRRLDPALAAAAAQSGAVDRQLLFQLVTAPLEQLDGGAGDLLGTGLPFLAHALGADGTWSAGAGPATVTSRVDAAAAALAAGSGGPGSGGAGGTAADAASAFDATLWRLGVPTGPVPPAWSWQQTLLDSLPEPEPLTGIPDPEMGEPGGGRRPAGAPRGLPTGRHPG